MGSCSRKTEIMKGQRQILFPKVEVVKAYKNPSYHKIK